MKLHLLKTLGALALGLTMMNATATEARADSITYRGVVDASTSSASRTFSIRDLVRLPKFDEDYGTLRRVTVFGRVAVENSVNLHPLRWISVSWAASSAVSASAPGFREFLTGRDISRGSNPEVGPGVSVSMDSSAVGTGSSSSTAPGHLNFYSSYRGDFFIIDVTGSGSTAYRTSGPFRLSVHNRQIGDNWQRSYVGVRYDYDPVPEPSTMALLGLAGAGVLWRRRRKNRA